MKKTILATLAILSFFSVSDAHASAFGGIFKAFALLGEKEAVSGGRAIGGLFSKESRAVESSSASHIGSSESPKFTKKAESSSETGVNTTDTSYIGHAIGVVTGSSNDNDDKKKK